MVDFINSEFNISYNLYKIKIKKKQIIVQNKLKYKIKKLCISLHYIGKINNTHFLHKINNNSINGQIQLKK